MRMLIVLTVLFVSGCATTANNHLTFDIKGRVDDKAKEGLVPSVEFSAQYKF